MVTQGLLVRFEVRPGKDEETEVFLRSALAKVQSEPATSAWFAVRFGRSDYGIFDVFADEAGRQAHLNGAVARGIMERVGTLFSKAPRIQKLDVIAAKLPASATVEPLTKGLFLTFKAKFGHEQQVEQFLRDAQDIVREEPKTVSWFAIRLENGEYGIFDVFPDSAGRFTHLTGHVPRELAKHALSLLGGFPDIDLLNVLASLPGVEGVDQIIADEREGI
jgi:quinol monooxygenase YgiN